MNTVIWLDVPDQIYFINQKTSETKLQVDFELASALDLDGISLPRRQILCDACLWRYRSGEGCTYSGPPVADKFDNPTTDPEQDNCGKRVTSCQLRFGDTGVLPFGGFPGANKYPF
jgi:lambda family phage minor tail protein L